MKKYDFLNKNVKDFLFIENDNLFVCQRLKEIDESYRVVFNLKKNQYEVHSIDQPYDTYSFAVPFSVLDERTVSYALKTRRENMDKIIKEIDFYNEKLYNQMIKQNVNKIKEALC